MGNGEWGRNKEHTMSKLSIELLAALMHRHGWRLVDALAGVFAKQKLRSVLLAGMLIGLTGCGDGAGGGPGGPGSPGNPFIVDSMDSLYNVGTGNDGWGLDACYKQTEDITLSGYWPPIGTSANPFTGTYDGGGKTITGLKVDRATNYNGLFGFVDGGTIRGVRLTNVAITITGIGNNTGSVAGSIENGAMISNCSAAGTITAYSTVGGIAGSCSSDSIVEHCSSGVTVTGTGSRIGGVVGENYGIIKYCSSSGAVKGLGFTGGIAGDNFGSVQNCYATGSVTGTNFHTGGIVGDNVGTVEYCYASGNVSGDYCVGGIVGVNYSTVQNCAAICAQVTASYGDAGRVIGCNRGTATNCFGFQGMFLSSVLSPDTFPGFNVTPGQYSGQTWWQSAPSAGPGFNFGASGAWKWDSAKLLPVLK